MREIVPNVLTWSRPSERHGYDFNGHLIRHPDGNLCVDPVEPDDAVLDQLAAIGATRVLLTNRNHTRAANLFRARLGARTAIHPKDAEYARGQGAEIDDELDVGERIGPLQVVGVPGKSSGEVCLFWEERRLLIVGDAIIGNPPGRCGVLPEKVMDDPLQMKQSIEEGSPKGGGGEFSQLEPAGRNGVPRHEQVLGEEFLMLEETGTDGRGVADDRDAAGFHPQNAEAACLRYGSGTLLPKRQLLTDRSEVSGPIGAI